MAQEKIIFENVPKPVVEQIRKYLDVSFPDILTESTGATSGLMKVETEEEEEARQQAAYLAANPVPNIPARATISHTFFPGDAICEWMHKKEFLYKVVGDDGSGTVRIQACARNKAGTWVLFAGSPFGVPHSELNALPQGAEPACLKPKQSGPAIWEGGNP